MNTSESLRGNIAELDQEIARLNKVRGALVSALDMLGETKQPLAAVIPPTNGTRTREQMLLDIVRQAGKEGMTRRDIIRAMQRVCDSPPTSISTMLSRLTTHGSLRNKDGQWIAN